jgi:uncharacterized protein (TIRG00374 family)
MAKRKSDSDSVRRSFIGNVIRIGAGFALLALLYYWNVIDLGALNILIARPDIFALTLATSLANIPLEALRWHVLLRAQGIDLRLWCTIRALATSVFFANFLPGAAGGDLVRGVYVYKAAPGRRAAAMLSIMIDRLIGIVAFVLLGLGAMLARPIGRPSVMAGPLEFSVFGLSALFIALLVLLFFYGHVMAQRLQRMLRGRSARLAQIVDDGGAALRQYARDWRSASLAMLLSVVIVGLAVGPIVLIAEAMPLGDPSAADYAIAGLYALIANSLPVTPGGLGIGEGAFASAVLILAPQAGYAPYGTIFLAFRCVFILSTLPGLLTYLTEL